MKALTVSLVLMTALAASAGDDTICVFVADKNGKPADLPGWTVSVTVEAKGMEPKTVPLEMKINKGSDATTGGTDHGGQTVEVDGLVVELVAGWSPGGSCKMPWYEGAAPIKGWSCPMECVDPLPTAGKCPKCDMDLEDIPKKFSATVTLKGPAGEKVFKGFTMPGPVPATYAEAVKEMRAHATKAVAKSAAIVRVRRLRVLAEALPTLSAAQVIKVKADAIREVCDEAEAALMKTDRFEDALKTLEIKVSKLPETPGDK